MAGNMIPRPEHPRPDLYRSTESGWLNLNGPWEFRFDPQAQGEQEQWYAGEEAFDRTIIVPFCWESHCAWGTEALAGNRNWFSPEAYLEPGSVTRENYLTAPRHTVGWYRKVVRLREDMKGERLFLNIGAVDWHVKVWANGQFVGESDSGYVPVCFDLADAVEGEELLLVIRVEDPQGTEDKPLGKQHKWYTTTSGIWQTVWLERRPQRHLTQVQLTPHLSPATVECKVRANVPLEGLAVRVTVVDEEGNAAGRAMGGGDLTVAIEGATRLWSPETPHLYTVKAELLEGDEVLDTLHSYFGLREVEIKPLYEGGSKYFLLNGQPLYLKGALDQSYNPWGVYTFPSEQDIVRDLELAEEAGFNFLRIHIKPEDPRFLYQADKRGMLIMFDLPNLGYDGYGEVGNDRWEWTFRRIMERDYNHPCIFAWVLFNETWGLGFKEYRDATDRQEWVKSMYRLAKSLDQSRPIEDNSACSYDHVLTDFNSWHFYINDYEQAREHIEKVVRETYPGSEFNYVGGNKQGDEPLINSEYGGIGAGMGDVDVSWCFKFLTDLLRRQEKVCGYIYTELQDIEWEHNGIYDYDRRPKEFGYRVKDLQGPVYLGFDCPPARTVACGERVELPMFVARPGAAWPGGSVTYSISGVDALGKALELVTGETVELPAEMSAAVYAFELPEFHTPTIPALLRVEARLGEEVANWCYLEVRDEALPAVETLADGRVVLRKQAGQVEVSTAWHEAEVERGVVDFETHLLGGIESGHMDYKFTLPEGVDLESVAGLTVLFEASSKRNGAPQTSEDKWLSDLHTSLNGVTVDVRTLKDQAADSRGALSHLHGLRGRYGELVRIQVGGEQLAQLKRLNQRDLLLRLAVPRSALNHRGLITYSSRAGRYPCDISVLVTKEAT
ncbi:MAG: glycoside hydrolase family 2 protein [Armatimonadota bacterium]